jgi:hypothetical protein
MRDEVIIDLDRQVQEALNVDPSPEFQARVRLRLSEEPQRYRLGTGWLVCGVTGLAVVALLAMFVSGRDGVQPRQAHPVAPAPPSSAAVVEPMPPPAIEKPIAGRRPRVTRSQAAERVLVPAAEREAFRRFVLAVTENALTYSVSPDVWDDAPLSVPAITIEPIVIEPIDTAAE